MANNYFWQGTKIAVFILVFFVTGTGFCSATTIISPLLDIEADLGQTQRGVVKIFNETSQDLYLSSSIEAFSAKDESGQPQYLVESEKNKFLDWFSLEQDSILLKPRQVAIVPFSINVPADAVPGGYYAVIFWGTAPDFNVADVPLAVKSKVGTLVFLKVNGEIEEKAEISDFFVLPEKKYLFRFPLNFVVRISNIGNVHLVADGQIELSNKLGFDRILKVNDSKNYILPKSTRRFELLWGVKENKGNFFSDFWTGLKQELNNKAFGKYTATLSINYGTASQGALTKQLEFWFIPWHLIVSSFAVLLVLIIFIFINSKINKLKKLAKAKQNASQS